MRGLELRVIAVALTAIALTASPAFAEASGPDAPAADTAAPTTPAPAAPAGTPLKLRTSDDHPQAGPSGTDIGLKLALVAAVLLGAALYLRRRNATAATAGGRPSSPKILSRTSIGVRSELIVVEADGQRLLLGITPTNVSTLSVLAEDPKEAPAEPKAARMPAIYPPRFPSESGVGESLSRLLAGARAELDRREETPRELSSLDSVAPAVPKSSEAAPKHDVVTTRRPHRRAAQSLEGQVRGLGSKRA